MLIEGRLVGWDGVNNRPTLNQMGEALERMIFSDTVVMGIDGSSTCTGVAFARACDGAYCGSIALKRSKHETPVEYKVELKKALYKLFGQNRHMTWSFYEEPFIGEYAQATKVLLTLRTSVDELKAENKEELKYLHYMEVSNSLWKRLFLAPDKIPSGTEAQKAAIRAKILKSLPFLQDITQDECDAYGLAYTAAGKLAAGKEDELRSKTKVRPFKYEVEFYGGNGDDDGVLSEIVASTKAHYKAKENGIGFQVLEQYKKLDDLVYESIGNDDTVQILRMPTKKCGNISLKYGIGNIISEYPYLYIVVWRTTRK